VRLLFVVQRYGIEVAGGAERACREYATHLAGRGHEVEVLTSCARAYTDWANEYPPGTTVIDGVKVHRLPVRAAREDRFFGPLNGRVVWGRKPVPLYLQEQWMASQGPLVEGIEDWLEEHAWQFDFAIFFTYLYYTTWAGLPVAASATATILHPTAHDEPPLYLEVFDTMFRTPSALAFLTHEEEQLVIRRFHPRAPSKVVGVGVDVDAVGDGAAFRERFGLGDRPYLTYVGRVDPGKGATELFDYFVAYKERRPGPLALVVVGDPVSPVLEHPDIISVGFVDEALKDGAVAGATAFVQPSYFESFSMVLVEAWLQGTPALVQGRCDVLVGQARRSGGGIPYRGYAEFEAAVDLLLEQPALAARLGEAGRAFVRATYGWETVLDNYERFLRRVKR
jgi:glycosyltransferase involved in cell wall biosynthesis